MAYIPANVLRTLRLTSYIHTHLSPHHSPYPNSNAATGPDKLAYYYQPHSKETTQTLPITRIHTTPANITKCVNLGLPLANSKFAH